MVPLSLSPPNRPTPTVALALTPLLLSATLGHDLTASPAGAVVAVALLLRLRVEQLSTTELTKRLDHDLLAAQLATVPAPGLLDVSPAHLGRTW